jgi:predicted transcriptional regulator
MAARKTPQPPHSVGNAWGRERVRLGVSLRRLSDLSGVPKSYLSMAEAGRLIPSGEEWEKVMAALRSIEQEPTA